ncbi:hypothetical protein [Paraburkholderia sp. UCT2]|uniref:hypothetical protein n=1 Tax=Paraburkholderia sp. UCT2 TaxID=2615208 RepID=UPI00165661FE|nr:hypothetical protein [Paraburkholderia sp. UCT2]MBC8732969.1 hypothetical protein [Paraburkholderia sp. UCT2]
MALVEALSKTLLEWEWAAPTLAILLEVAAFPNDRQIRNGVDELVRDEKIKEPIENFTRGVLAIYGLAPTLVAVLATMTSLYRDSTVLMGTLLALIFAIVVLIAVFGGRRFHELTDGPVISIRGINHELTSWPWVRIISWVIRFVNLCLIVLIFWHGACSSQH